MSVLSHNTVRLTTKGDIRKTNLFLADWQLNREERRTPKHYYNLLKEPVPD